MKYNTTMQQFLSDGEIRQKLVSRGVEALDDAELLSVLLQENKGNEAHMTASRLLKDHGNNPGAIARTDLKKLRLMHGLGIRRAGVVAAALELGRRIAENSNNTISLVEGSHDIILMFKPKLGHLRHEEFWAVYLSSGNTVLDTIKVSQGGVSSTTVDHKIIIKRAVELLSAAIIVVHNHPSGIAVPSEEDKVLTAKIKEGAEFFDIGFHDHIIVTSGDCFSFRQHGLI